MYVIISVLCKMSLASTTMSTDYSEETLPTTSVCHQCQCNVSNGVLAGALSVAVVIIVILVLIVMLLLVKMKKMK